MRRLSCKLRGLCMNVFVYLNCYSILVFQDMHRYLLHAGSPDTDPLIVIGQIACTLTVALKTLLADSLTDADEHANGSRL
jgi:hypothetical protein